MLNAQIEPMPLELELELELEVVRSESTFRLVPPLVFPDGTQVVDVVSGEPMPPRLGNYRVLALLARGGMCAVYLGEHLLTGERVALKALDTRWWQHQNIVDRMQDEHEVSRRAPHHGLVEISEAGLSEEGVPYLAMEMLDGENLATLLVRGRVEVGAIAAIGAQVADAVAALHTAGVVHCDLKPENIMVMYQEGVAGWPRVKVLDFGVARFGDRVLADEIAGTPCYMAPEQWRGRAEARSDVYALGCLLYELITGVAPFEGSVSRVMVGHCDELPAPLTSQRSIPEALDRLVMRMLAKDPGMRPRMADVARSLTDVSYAHPPGARAEERWAVMGF